MKRTLILSLVAVLGVPGLADAGAVSTTTLTVVAKPPLQDAGSESIPAAAGTPVAVTAGGVLDSAGSEGAVQSAASLPRGFTDGTNAAPITTVAGIGVATHAAATAYRRVARIDPPRRG